ncbi:MAG: penicillin acylase family protein [Chloroflexota bacterium]
MASKILRIILSVLGVILVLVLLIAIIAPPLVRAAAKRSFPQINGDIQVPGLDGPVDIYRDSFGIPHIYAATQHDLFFAQGYVHAQDRFWQMDFWRHQGAGRLSELLGEATLDIDVFLRTLGWERVAKEELKNMEPEPLAILEAYAEGVNAYLAEHKGTALSLEYAFLPIINPSYEPEPWTPLNTLTWAKVMAWDLSGNMDTEIDRAMLLNTLTSDQVDQLYPPYPADHPVIVPHLHITGETTTQTDTNLFGTKNVYSALETVQQHLTLLNALTLGSFEGIGSNNWVISGALTDTGMPILANDPHLGVQMPSIWYEIGLHCVSKGSDCPYDLAGFSFAGAPGVVIGHNDHIAWGFTNVGPDVMDLYIEKINPDNPQQYEFQGEWVDMEIIHETINIAGGEAQDVTVYLTQHGPLITSVYGLEDFADQAGIDIPEHFAIALRWTALEPSCVFCALWEFNIAQDWEDFRAAASKFVVPSQNLAYADIEGNIGYQTPGNIPIRTEGHSGVLPVPGWTGEFEWQGYIPFDELPFAFNPPEGYIVTANNAVVGPEYPYLLSMEWAYGFRAQRIVDMLNESPGVITIAYTQQMQGDNKELGAVTFVPILLQIPLNEERLINARNILVDWDYQFHMDSAPAALYAAFWRQLILQTFNDDLPEFYSPGGGSRWMEVTRNLIKDPNSPWWDDKTTPEIETRDDIFARAFTAAVEELEKLLGKKPAGWAWGDLHTISFNNDVMSNFPLIDTAFNRGPFPTSGGAAIVNATGWSTTSPYTVHSVPSMRMIIDLGDLSNSFSIHTTGQSGHAYHPHYIDMIDLWRTIEYHPMLWDQDSVEGAAEGHLRLIP